MVLDLERYYSVGIWPMRPDDVRAQERFKRIVELFSFLVERHPFLASALRGKSSVRVLDVMAGSGIAGAAFARVLSFKGFSVELTVSDVRSDDFGLVNGWLGNVGNVKVESLVANVSELPKALPEREKHYDVVLLWGCSTPHLDPWNMAKAYASICYVLKDDGVLAFDEVDRIFNIFYRVGYKDLLVEREAPQNMTIISVHRGYDEKRGVFRRTTYTLPEFKEVSTLSYRFWNLAGITAMGWLFFHEIDIMPPKTHNIQGIQNVVVLARPRRKISSHDLEKEPSFLSVTN